MTKLISFSGGMAAGKDTMGICVLNTLGIQKRYHFSFSQALRKEVQDLLDLLPYKDTTYVSNYFNVSTKQIEKVREIINGQYHLMDACSRTVEMRNLLQYWGTEVRRNSNSLYWINIAKEIITTKLNEGYTVFVTDARFKNEIDLINSLGGVTVCLDADQETRCNRIFDRDGIYPTEESLNHVSEKDYLDYPFFSFRLNNSNQTIAESTDAIVEYLNSIEFCKR